jgi:uncharacterized protein
MPEQPDDLFEWDSAKNLKNRLIHGVDFNLAAQIFDGEIIEEDDLRRDYGERRIIATGRIQDDYFTVVFTWRGIARRLISARRASRRERRDHRAAYPETDYEKRRR